MAKTRGPRSRVKKPKPMSAKAVARKTRRRTVSMHMVRRVRSKKIHQQTSIEATVEKWLLEAEVPYRAEYPISRVHVDFFLPDATARTKGTVVEVQGCFWHGCKTNGCNPKGLSKQQMKARRRDGRRYTFLRNASYKLVLLWEHEIKNDPDAARKKLLKYYGLV